MPRTPPAGVETMRALAVGSPEAFAQGFRDGLALRSTRAESAPRIYAVGMGASGIVADLARSVVDAETNADLTVQRGVGLPGALSRRAHVLLTSYSGNTWETLRAYEHAGRVGAARTAITSGGELAERAEADGVPVLRVPPGMPPRAAIGHLLGGTLGVLDPLFPESNEERAARVAERVRTAVRGLSGPRGLARALAKRLGRRLPLVYAESAFLPLARRWKSQLEENAKHLAVFDEVPELFHNAIVGWDALTRPDAARLTTLLLEWSEEDPHLRKSFRYLERLLRSRGVPVLTVPLPPEDRLEALLYGVVLGDLTSIEWAALRKVDPLPVEAITRLKARVRPDGAH